MPLETFELPHLLGDFNEQRALQFVHNDIDMNHLAHDLGAFVSAQEPRFASHVYACLQNEELVLGGRHAGITAPMTLGLMIIRDQVSVSKFTDDAMEEVSQLHQSTGLDPDRWLYVVKGQVRVGCPAYFKAARHVVQEHRFKNILPLAMEFGLMDGYLIANRQLVLDKLDAKIES